MTDQTEIKKTLLISRDPILCHYFASNKTHIAITKQCHLVKVVKFTYCMLTLLRHRVCTKWLR